MTGRMTAEHAIKVLKLDKECEFDGSAVELEDALQLGTEALEWLSAKRKTSPALANIYLPSERIPGATDE